MRRWLFVLWFTLGGPAGAEESDESINFIDTSEFGALFWKSPECPEDFGPIVIEMPPAFGYETLHIDCGRIIANDQATEEDERE